MNIPMTKAKSQILSDSDIVQKIKRMAIEIAEDNYTEDELVFIGIYDRGSVLAKRLADEVKKTIRVKTSLYEVKLNKAKPAGSALLMNFDENALNNKVVILTDDVANTGKTMFYALQPILQSAPRKVQVAVLVDRKHKQFPIASDYTGLQLSTTMQEHIFVKLGVKSSVYLA